jgi:hypothetical protein
MLSHQIKRKKRVWRQFCEWLSEAVAHLPAAVSQLLLEALLIADLRSEPHKLCFLSVLLGVSATVTSFPLSKHTGGGGTTHAFSGCMFIYNSRGKWPFPPLLWSFPHTTTFTNFPTPCCWAGAATPAFSGQLVYLQFCEGFPDPPLWCSGRPTLFATCVFCCCCLFSLFFSLFSLGGGWSVQGAMLIWPRVVCGSTACCLAHLVVCIFPSGLGTGIWWCGSPPGFSI